MHIPHLLDDHIAIQLPDGAILDNVAVLYTYVEGDDIKVACAPSETTTTEEGVQLAVNFVINLQAQGWLTPEHFQLEDVPHDPYPEMPNTQTDGPGAPTPDALPPDRYPINPEITD